MAVPRIDQITGPAEVGRCYLVPTVRYLWFGQYANWPVFLPLHEDAEHFEFPHRHYHIDPRFVPERVWRREENGYRNSAAAAFQAAPLHTRDEPHPPVVWRRVKCKREMPRYVFGAAKAVQSIRRAYAGQQCRRGRAGWICPHRKFALGSVPAVDGVITCPGHGLRICATTGVVLAAKE